MTTWKWKLWYGVTDAIDQFIYDYYPWLMAATILLMIVLPLSVLACPPSTPCDEMMLGDSWEHGYVEKIAEQCAR
jgi:hypothetical protein